MSDKLKKLTGKNPKEFEPVAFSLINDCDTELFAQLVEKEDFLFDFVKQNVSSRLEKVCNKDNYLNLLSFLKYYSPSYEDFIISVLTKYADEDLTDKMLEVFESGTDEEKTYCAKYFSVVQDPLAIDFLRQNAYSQNSYLSTNCVSALAMFGDKEIYDKALEKLASDDDFEVLDAVKLLVSYGDKNALSKIIEVLKKSALAENIASEIPYLYDLYDLLDVDRQNALYILNLIVDGLGEVVSLAQVFDFRLYEIFEKLLNEQLDSEMSIVLLNAREKFNTLTENDEYLYDETKDVKQEVLDIRSLLAEFNGNPDEELKTDSLFVFSALELTSNRQKVRELLSSDNQTVVVKALEILKKLGSLNSEDKNIALESVVDKNLADVIIAM